MNLVMKNEPFWGVKAKKYFFSQNRRQKAKMSAKNKKLSLPGGLLGFTKLHNVHFLDYRVICIYINNKTMNFMKIYEAYLRKGNFFTMGKRYSRTVRIYEPLKMAYFTKVHLF